MRDFFTNNGAYMTLMECMAHDYFWIGALVLLVTTTALLYSLVCVEAWREYVRFDRRKSPLSGGIMALMLVFAGCGLTGYLTDLIGMFFPAYRIKVLLLIPLNIATLGLVYYLRKHNVIQRIFRAERLGALTGSDNETRA